VALGGSPLLTFSSLAGSEVYVYGDRALRYGSFTAQVDDEPATVHTAFWSAHRAMSLIYALRGLPEGWHELRLEPVGNQSDPDDHLGEGKEFLFDYAVVR